MFNRWYSKPMLGLDVSASSLIAIGISTTKKNCIINYFAHVMLASQETQSAAFAEEAFLASMEALAKKLPKGAYRVALAISDALVLSRSLEVPAYLSAAEIREYIAGELQTLIPYQSEEILFDFLYLPKNENAALTKIFILAIRLRFLQARIAALKKIGWTVSYIGIDSYATLQALQHLPWKKLPYSAARDFILFYFYPDKIHAQLIQQQQRVSVYEEEIESETNMLIRDLSAKAILLLNTLKKIAQCLQQTPSSAVQVIFIAGFLFETQPVVSFLENWFKAPVSVCNPFTEFSIAKTMQKAVEAAQIGGPETLLACGLACMRGRP